MQDNSNSHSRPGLCLGLGGRRVAAFAIVDGIAGRPSLCIGGLGGRTGVGLGGRRVAAFAIVDGIAGRPSLCIGGLGGRTAIGLDLVAWAGSVFGDGGGLGGRTAIGLDPGSARAYIGLADALSALGMTTEAQRAYDRAVDLDPSIDRGRYSTFGR